VYESARKLGLHTTVHAGEAAGPESVRGALHSLHPERIGHGTRAVEDDALMDELVKSQVPLELCPISNVGTGVVKSIEEHPARRFFERGLAITVNTDDPKMFGNSLMAEYWMLEERLGFSRDEIRTLVLNGIRCSWLPPERKRDLEAAFIADPAFLAAG
jgi:adenosine deaminase